MRYFRLACAVAFLLASAGLAAAQTRLLDISQERMVEVTGEASVNAPPDFAMVTLGVTTTGKDAREAMSANAKRRERADRRDQGGRRRGGGYPDLRIVDHADFLHPAARFAQTARDHRIQCQRQGHGDRPRPFPPRRTDRQGGRRRRQLRSMESLYGENDPSALLDKARPLAVADAKRKAEIYANAGGAKVGRLMELSEQAGGQPVPFARRAYAQSAGAAPTPIEAGEDRLTVTVTARFELTQ